jgi:HlyD family secretion protein
MASSSVPVPVPAPVPAVPEPRSLERSSSPVDRQRRERHRARMKLLRRGLWSLVLAGAGLATALALRPQPVPVDVARAELGPLEVGIEESGHTRVKDRYVVSALVTGQLSRIWLESGDAVTAGDTLAEIAPSLAPLFDERSQAEAEAKVGAAISSVGQARTRWARTVAASELADRELVRARALAASGARTPQELEGAEFAARMQRDEVASAQFAVDVAEEEVRLARAALGGQREPRRDRHVDVLAPASGRVLRVLQQSAGLVQAGTPLVEVGDPAVLEGVVDLLTTDAVQVRPGMPVSIVGWGGELGVDARVKRVEPSGFTRLSALGVEEQRVNVIVVFTEPSQASSALADGYHIEARFVLWQSPSVVKVPLLAVFRHGGGSATFKLEGNVARLTPITLGHRGALDVEVVSGLNAGDVVVIHPGDRVSDGVKVAVL